MHRPYAPRQIRFGVFALDLASGELRKSGSGASGAPQSTRRFGEVRLQVQS
jgi:hypothetical protein